MPEKLKAIDLEKHPVKIALLSFVLLLVTMSIWVFAQWKNIWTYQTQFEYLQKDVVEQKQDIRYIMTSQGDMWEDIAVILASLEMIKKNIDELK